MSAKRYTAEFRIEAVKQVAGWGHPVAEAASRLGVTSHSLYQWIRRYRVPEGERLVTEDQNAELKRLKANLRRFTEEFGRFVALLGIQQKLKVGVGALARKVGQSRVNCK
jgi:transposase